MNYEVETIGYVLLKSTYKKEHPDGKVRYYGVFQQRDQEWILELTHEQYVKWQSPIRGYLRTRRDHLHTFEL